MIRRKKTEEQRAREVLLATRLRAAREAAGVTSENAARAVRIHRQCIYLLEAGKRHVRALELVTLAKLYGVSMEKLLEGL